MSNLPQTLLGRYQYTALDKLSACTLGAQPSSQRFYLGERLSTEIQGAVQHSIMQHEDQLLAQRQRQAGTLHTHLLATDQQRSVLTLLDASRPQHLAYSPYGHRTSENGLLSLLGFNGERPDPVTGHYLLGNGYRAFNLVLMRFNTPDSWSPFGKGGLNAYGYCVGDPVNRSDPTWHSNFVVRFGKGLANLLGLRHRTPQKSPAWTTQHLFPEGTASTSPQTSAMHSRSSGSVDAPDEPSSYTNSYNSLPRVSSERAPPATNSDITEIQGTVIQSQSSAWRGWQRHDKPPPYSNYAPPGYEEWLKQNSTLNTDGLHPKDIRDITRRS